MTVGIGCLQQPLPGGYRTIVRLMEPLEQLVADLFRLTGMCFPVSEASAAFARPLDDDGWVGTTLARLIRRPVTETISLTATLNVLPAESRAQFVVLSAGVAHRFRFFSGVMKSSSDFPTS